ncbi:MAG: DNA polymerase III subunit delta' [Desulfuromonadaceae bacterium]|nr:DNA polymerase III subunit delta' [Desulfuromonas sp.]MDY0184652.1 DNA polymerase III subunit delta' [Desulfuromonadaceae bacterium]
MLSTDPFTAIIGHERQKKLLQHAFTSGKLAHAYLFSGFDGIGKRLMALALARLVFCDAGNGCGKCSSCRRIDHNNHPDLHTLEPDGQFIKIEQIRVLQRALAYRPLESTRHIVLIDAAERMHHSAANAMLKTLEEPPYGTIIILLSSQPQALLPTVRSRCQHLPFSRLRQTDIDKVLQSQVADETERNILAALAQGSLNKAFGSDRDFYLNTRRDVFTRISRLQPGSILPMLDLAAELGLDREYAEAVTDILISCYRDLFIITARGSSALLVNTDLEQSLQHLARKHTPASALAMLESILRCRTYLQHNVNHLLAMEWLLSRLVFTAPTQQGRQNKRA